MLSANSTEGTIYIEVDDLDAACAALTENGTTLEQQPTLVHRDEAGQFGEAGQEEWMAFVRDPAGNLVGLVERR